RFLRDDAERRHERRELPSRPNIGRAVPVQQAHLMRTGGALRLFAEVDVKAVVELQPATFGIDIDLQQVRARFADRRIELVVPSAEERVGDVQPLAVEAELQHLWAPRELLATDFWRFG